MGHGTSRRVFNNIVCQMIGLPGSTLPDPVVDYQADARGYVYFYLDRRDIDERTLVKTDQVALQVFWKAPNLTKQVIVGMRDRKTLPTNIHYHLDHLAVVQDNFGDRINSFASLADGAMQAPTPGSSGSSGFSGGGGGFSGGSSGGGSFGGGGGSW